MLPPPPPAVLPYSPRNRRTPPTSVLIPLTPAELQAFKIPRHALRIRAAHPDPALDNPNFFPSPVLKRKRTPDDDSPAAKRVRGDDNRDPLEDDPAVAAPATAAERTRDTGLVVEHYNARRDVGVVERRDSPIIGLKNFNNWIKSVLIAKFAKHAFAAADPDTPAAPTRGRVLDMGCGKGGDLQKWQKARIKEYVGLDIAAVSIDQARTRWAQMKGQRFAAHFAALDCYTVPLAAALPAAALARPFDAVSLQFCMHYAFESAPKAHTMLANVAAHLRPGGVFLGTVPNAALLLERLAALPAGAPPTFGNAVYQIRFEDRAPPAAQPFGHRYWFFLQDAVHDVPEYVVPWPAFERLAQEHGLHLLYKREFHDVFAAERAHPAFAPLLQRMKVVDARGESHMDEDQWEAANIYLAFAFEKR